MIKFTAELEPVPYKRPRFNGKHAYNERRYTDYKDAVGYIAKRAMKGAAPLKGKIQITIKVVRNLKPSSLNYGDWDNYGKAICDALNGVCYNDDRQVISGYVYLRKGKPPRIEVELEELI